MGILDFLSKRSTPSTRDTDPEWVKDAVLPVSETGIGISGIGGFVSAARLPRRGTQELLYAYQTHPYLRSVVGKIATNASAVPLRLFARRQRGGRKDRRPGQGAVLDEVTRSAAHVAKWKRLKALKAGQELDEIVDHPMLRLLRAPWPGMRGRELLKLTFAWLDLIGDAFWIYNTNVAGMPTEIFPVPPHWVVETPTPPRPFFTVRINAVQFEIPITNVLWFKDPSLENPFGRGAGVGLALSDELDIDENAAKHVASFFHNRAMPDMLVSVEGGDEDVLRATKAKFEQDYRGIVNAYRTAFLNGKVTVERLDTNFKDMNLVELRKHSGRDIVTQAFGLSPEMLGILDSSNRATIAEARAMFAENVLIPRISLVEEVLQEFALLFDERLIVAFDDPRPDDAAAVLRASEIHPSSRTENEWRGLQGLEPIEGGDVHYVDAAKIPVERLDAALIAADAAAVAAGAAGEPVQDTALNGAQVTALRQLLLDVAMGIMPKLTARAAILAMFPSLLPASVDAMLTPIVAGSVAVPAVAGADPGAAAVDDDETETEAPETPDGDAEVDTAKAAPSTFRTIKAIEIEEFDVDEFLNAALSPEQMSQEIRDVSYEVANAVGSAEARALGAGATWSIENPIVAEYVDNVVATKINGLVDETTRNALRATLVEGVQAGEAIPALAARVQSVFREADDVRARLIARTEVGGLANRAVYAAHVMSGVVQRRQWVASMLRTRDSHKAMNGQIVAITERFKAPSGATTDAPGGFGIAKEDCNCACTTIALGSEDPGRSVSELEAIQRDFETLTDQHAETFERAIQRGFARQRDDVVAALRALA